MISGATYSASGNHERTCTSCDGAGAVSFIVGDEETFIARGGATTAELVLIIGAAASPVTLSFVAPTLTTTEKMARSPSLSEKTRAAVMNPGDETCISKGPGLSSAKANRPSWPDASMWTLAVAFSISLT